MSVVYLLHFARPYRHARHYLGVAPTDLERRLALHRAGQGARLMTVIREAGIDFQLARTWDGGRALERRLKRGKCGPKLCPICTARPWNLTPTASGRGIHAPGAPATGRGAGVVYTARTGRPES